MQKEKGLFIVFEGVGGSGKSTQVELAADFLREKGFEVITTREPGGTKASEMIRDMIFTLREKGLIGPDEQMVLFFAARKIWAKEVVKPALSKGMIVLADRSYPSTAAYQGFAEGGDLKKIEALSEVIMKGVIPDAVLLIDVSPDTAIQRRKLETDDPFDREEKDYYSKVINGYRKMAASGWGGLKWYIVNGEGTIEEVREEVIKIIRELISKR